MRHSNVVRQIEAGPGETCFPARREGHDPGRCRARFKLVEAVETEEEARQRAEPTRRRGPAMNQSVEARR